MKKKILALLVTFMMMFTMVGCNAQGVELLSQLKEVSTWEAVETKSNVELGLTYQGEYFKVNAQVTSYTNNKELQMESTMIIKSVEAAGQKLDVTKAPFKLSPVKFYMDGMKFYMNTSIIKEIATMIGADVASGIDVSKDYIAIDLTSAMEMSGMNKEQLIELSNQNFDIYANSKVELPVTKKDQTYTIELKDAQLVDVLFDFCNEAMDTQTAVLTDTYKSMGMTDEQIKEALVQAKAVYGPETKALVKPMLAGSTAKASYTFNKDSYLLDTTADLKLLADGQTAEINITEKAESKKVAKKVITFPTSVKMYTMEDLMALNNPSKVIQVAQKDCITEKGVTYVPLKATLAQAGVTVGYDSKTKTTYIKEFDNKPIKSMIKNGVSYVTVEQLAELDIVCQIVK